MYITKYLAAIVLAFTAIIHGVNVILGARKWLVFWDKFIEDEEAVFFVSRRRLKKSAFRKVRKRRPYQSAYFGVACIAFGICIILVALGTLLL